MIENVMKIYFLVAQSEGKFPDLKIWYTQVSSPTEANRITRGAIDNKIYELIRTLEDNKDFVGDVVSIRNRFDIPSDGYSLKEWDEARKVKKEDKSYSKWKLELEKSCRELGKQYKIPFLLQGSLVYIVIGNFVYLPLAKLFLERANELLPIYDGPEIKISIFGQISKQQ